MAHKQQPQAMPYDLQVNSRNPLTMLLSDNPRLCPLLPEWPHQLTLPQPFVCITQPVSQMLRCLWIGLNKRSSISRPMGWYADLTLSSLRWNCWWMQLWETSSSLQTCEMWNIAAMWVFLSAYKLERKPLRRVRGSYLRQS